MLQYHFIFPCWKIQVPSQALIPIFKINIIYISELTSEPDNGILESLLFIYSRLVFYEIIWKFREKVRFGDDSAYMVSFFPQYFSLLYSIIIEDLDPTFKVQTFSFAVKAVIFSFTGNITKGLGQRKL